jgi:hypothetical protein
MRRDLQFRCHFAHTGFAMAGKVFRPCHVQYHPHCIRIGAPFSTRLDQDKGMFVPPAAVKWKPFICESCRVRSVLKRELTRSAHDVALLMLERAVMVDTGNRWSQGTLKQYASKNNVITMFERDFSLECVPCPSLPHPPASSARPLMWCQERYSLYPASWQRHAAAELRAVKWGTIRGI